MKRSLNTFASFSSIVGLLLTSAIAVQAEGPRISGFIDTTFNYDLNKPGSRITAGRSFDRKTDSFLLNAVQINFDGSEKEGIGYYGELAFGTDASVYKSAGTGADAGLPGAPSTVAYNLEIQEAFVTYKCPLTGIQLKAGKFVTQHGIEVIESKDNFTITRGPIFGLFEPYTHVGAMAGYAFGMGDVWLGVVNGWDLHIDNNKGKSLVARVGLNPSDKSFGSFSMTHGAEKLNNTLDARTTFDLTWFVKPMDNTTIGLQANTGQEDKSAVAGTNIGGSAHWYGLGIQPKYDFNKTFSLAGRYEWIQDNDGARNGSGLGIVGNSITITPTFNLSDSLVFRAEFRHDGASAKVYEKSDGTFDKDSVQS
ncbi:MAG: porin, partial [Elusimicrobia bacterium]|nr:porin [Elusimicrobiota bacterium]